jgi:hypothetical protein
MNLQKDVLQNVGGGSVIADARANKGTKLAGNFVPDGFSGGSHLATATSGRAAAGGILTASAAIALLADGDLAGRFAGLVPPIGFPFVSFSFHITYADAMGGKRTQTFCEPHSRLNA